MITLSEAKRQNSSGFFLEIERKKMLSKIVSSIVHAEHIMQYEFGIKKIQRFRFHWSSHIERLSEGKMYLMSFVPTESQSHAIVLKMNAKCFPSGLHQILFEKFCFIEEKKLNLTAKKYMKTIKSCGNYVIFWHFMKIKMENSLVFEIINI